MPETRHQTFSGGTDTLLVTLYLRALESQCPDTLITGEKAVELVKQMSYDNAEGRQIPMVDSGRRKRHEKCWEPGIVCVKQAES